MRADGVLTRRTSLFWCVSLAVLGNATLASAQAMPPAPPDAAPVAQPTPPPVAPNLAAPPPAPPAGSSGQPGPQTGPGYPRGAYPPPVLMGPSRLPYIENDVIPAGYEIQTRPQMGLAKAGIATFAPLYGLSALFGAMYLGAENGDASAYGPMVIPILGPFVTVKTANTDGGSLFLLLDGVGQLTGAVLFIVGMASEERYLARKTASSNLRPEVFVGPKSMALRWEF